MFCKAITKEGSVCTTTATCNTLCTKHNKMRETRISLGKQCTFCHEDSWNAFETKCEHIICSECFPEWFESVNPCTCPTCCKDCDVRAFKYSRSISDACGFGQHQPYRQFNRALNDTSVMKNLAYEKLFNYPMLLVTRPELYHYVKNKLLQVDRPDVEILCNPQQYKKCKLMLAAFDEKFGQHPNILNFLIKKRENEHKVMMAAEKKWLDKEEENDYSHHR